MNECARKMGGDGRLADTPFFSEHRDAISWNARRCRLRIFEWGIPGLFNALY
jgi:hypothetical protein